MFTSVDFLGVRFDQLSVEEICDAIKNRPASSYFEYLITPNTDHVVRLNYHDFSNDISDAYKDAFISSCDSKIMAHIARCFGIRMQVSCGSDVSSHMFEHFIENDDVITIIGGHCNTKDILMRKFNIANVFQQIPPMNLLNNPSAISDAVNFIIDHPARYVFLAVGSPQQELIAYRGAQSGRATGTGLCVGASIDFLTGDLRRAPRVFRDYSFEWLFRLLMEPKRLWRRYLIRSPRIFLLALKYRKNKSSNSLRPFSKNNGKDVNERKN